MRLSGGNISVCMPNKSFFNAYSAAYIMLAIAEFKVIDVEPHDAKVIELNKPPSLKKLRRAKKGGLRPSSPASVGTTFSISTTDELPTFATTGGLRPPSPASAGEGGEIGIRTPDTL